AQPREPYDGSKRSKRSRMGRGPDADTVRTLENTPIVNVDWVLDRLRDVGTLDARRMRVCSGAFDGLVTAFVCPTPMTSRTLCARHLSATVRSLRQKARDRAALRTPKEGNSRVLPASEPNLVQFQRTCWW